ncbi:amidohydrolase [Clostridium thermosuccinogenes]|nr:amidohydrolase [Pseudoclostridium thermosuccinogenes]PNT92555.1 amidohydrolase [Pseudoclostridium thermosuccinogenes]
MALDELKKTVCAAIDANREKIIQIGEEIYKHPELGYQEHKTSDFISLLFSELGLKNISRHAITGVRGLIPGRSHEICLAVMGELDAVICPSHPFADPASGAAHACGHNAQLASMIGCAIGLTESGAMEQLDGDICCFATPAEEYVQIEYRKQLMDQGKISYLGGKQQLIASGAFDDIDLAMMVHSETNAPAPRVVVNGSAMGFIGKAVRFIGKEAHAGGAPHEGINALNAASIAIMCINAQRETFRDKDSVRVHPIITKGGDLVNTVPADVRMESYVRANTIEAMQDANEKVNRAIRGASYAIGTTVEIDDMAGYLPLHQNEAMSSLFAQNAAELLGNEAVQSGLPFPGSTDVGDLSYIMPVIQPTVSGFCGAAHSRDFCIEDRELAYIVPAKLMALTAIDLLRDGARHAVSIRDNFPRKSVEQYKALWNDILENGR